MGVWKICLLLVCAFTLNVNGRSLTKDERTALINMLEKSLLQEVSREAGGGDDCNGDICIMNPAEVQQECLTAHNKVRAYHNAGDLEWVENPDSGPSSPTKWAMKLAQENTFQHASDRNGWGENIAMYSYMEDKPVAPCAQSVFLWYEELEHYWGGPGMDWGITGHFSQLVWKGSTKLNCGVVYTTFDDRKQWYVVCRYFEQGNFYGKFAENVDRVDDSLLKQLSSGKDLL